MKYARLTKEQFEALHEEFALFLASQSIDKNEWETLKSEKPHIAEEELDIFSDMVWKKTLSKVKFLENWSQQHLYLFQFDENTIKLIYLKVTNEKVNLLLPEGIEWLNKNLTHDTVEITKGQRNYTEDPNTEKFNFIKKGAFITEGKTMQLFYKMLGY